MNFRKASVLVVGAVILSALALSVDIFGQKSNRKICGPTASERLKTYFDLNEEKPAQIINNVDDNGLWESKVQSVKIGVHVVENAGFGARAAAPIARLVLDYYLLGKRPAVNPNAPAKETATSPTVKASPCSHSATVW